MAITLNRIPFDDALHSAKQSSSSSASAILKPAQRDPETLGARSAFDSKLAKAQAKTRSAQDRASRTNGDEQTVKPQKASAKSARPARKRARAVDEATAERLQADRADDTTPDEPSKLTKATASKPSQVDAEAADAVDADKPVTTAE